MPIFSGNYLLVATKSRHRRTYFICILSWQSPLSYLNFSDRHYPLISNLMPLQVLAIIVMAPIEESLNRRCLWCGLQSILHLPCIAQPTNHATFQQLKCVLCIIITATLSYEMGYVMESPNSPFTLYPHVNTRWGTRLQSISVWECTFRKIAEKSANKNKGNQLF